MNRPRKIITKIPFKTNQELARILLMGYKGRIVIESIRPQLKSTVQFSFPKVRTKPALN